MCILPLNKRLIAYLEKRDLVERYEKQRRLFETNPLRPGCVLSFSNQSVFASTVFALPDPIGQFLFTAETELLRLLTSTIIINEYTSLL